MTRWFAIYAYFMLVVGFFYVDFELYKVINYRKLSENSVSTIISNFKNLSSNDQKYYIIGILFCMGALPFVFYVFLGSESFMLDGTKNKLYFKKTLNPIKVFNYDEIITFHMKKHQGTDVDHWSAYIETTNNHDLIEIGRASELKKNDLEERISEIQRYFNSKLPVKFDE